MAKQSAQEICASRRLSGCNDWGLLLTAILRSLDYPVVFMNAAGIEWAKRYRNDPTLEFSGHAFLEIWVTGKWIVMDSVTGEYIQDYDIHNPVIPIPKLTLLFTTFYGIKGVVRRILSIAPFTSWLRTGQRCMQNPSVQVQPPDGIER